MSRGSNSLTVHTTTSQLIHKGSCSVKLNMNKIKQQECSPVGCVAPTCNRTGGSLWQRPQRTETRLLDRDSPWRETPWTETLLDRDTLWIETLPGQSPASQTETPLDRDPPPPPPWTDKHLGKHNFRKLRLRAVIMKSIANYIS